MCLILDASARDQVFGRNPTAVGRELFEWLEARRTRLVLGGKLTEELTGSHSFERWAETAVSDGRVRVFNNEQVDRVTRVLSADWSGESNDQHVIALAEVSRARILYADDGPLQNDFRNSELVSSPGGKLYPTGESRNATRHRLRLLRQTNLCPNR